MGCMRVRDGWTLISFGMQSSNWRKDLSALRRHMFIWPLEMVTVADWTAVALILVAEGLGEAQVSGMCTGPGHSHTALFPPAQAATAILCMCACVCTRRRCSCTQLLCCTSERRLCYYILILKAGRGSFRRQCCAYPSCFDSVCVPVCLRDPIPIPRGGGAATIKGMAWPANPVATGCQGLLNRHQVGAVSRSPDGLFAQQEREPIRGGPAVRGKRTYGGRPGQHVEEQGTWASRTQKHSEAGYGPVDRGA